MTNKFYGMFVVSREPIDLAYLADNPAVTHLINEEFEVKVHPDHGGWLIRKLVPHHFTNEACLQITGRGRSIPVVIADWIRTLVSSMAYLPHERKRRIK